METIFDTKKKHHGYNVKRLREILGVKQEDLAERLCITQQAVSKIEQKEHVEDEILHKIANALNIQKEAIKEFSDDTVSIITNTFNDSFNKSATSQNYDLSFNPIDKLVQLYDDKIELYERILRSEHEKCLLLETVLRGKI